MARRLTIQPLAQEDLENIFFYGLSEFGRIQAIKFSDKFYNCFENLRLFNIGTACFEIKPDLYRFPVGKYVVFFFRSVEEIKIVRILHSSQDVNHQLI